jgi:hypothetical protein
MEFDDKMADDLQDAINTGAGRWKLLKPFRNHFTTMDVRRMAARAPQSLAMMMDLHNTQAINDGFKDWLKAL